MLIVVTGAQGFLGRHVVARLAGDGHRVLAVDRRAAFGPAMPGVQNHISDLVDPGTLIPPDCEPVGRFLLIHLAWDLRLRESSYTVQSQQVTTLAGLLDAWTARGLQYLIAPGSAQEFGARGGEIGDDEAPIEPLSPYGWAKRAAFEMAESWSRNTGRGLLWLRPFIVYGPGQAGSMLVPYALRQALAKERAEFSEGTQVRDFVYVDDVVDAVARGVAQQPAGAHAVNLGSRDPVRICDLLREIGRHFGVESLFDFGAKPRRIGEPDVQVARIGRAAELLGWKPSVGWREGVRRLCEASRG